jgi:uncharacterized caspase-like protein
MTQRLRALLLVLRILMAVFAGAAGAETRSALIIGNGAYPEVPLRNPANDADAVASTLRQLGFTVTLVRDADWKTMIEAVREFLARAPATDVRIIFYAGHGVQVRGRNYLVPVDANMANVDELITRSLDVKEILDRLSRQASGLNLLILDACRNNPAGRYQLLADGRRVKARGPESEAKGLAQMHAPAGSLVAFSTAPGSVADDHGGGNNSLYTHHLLRHLATPNLPIEQMFKRVRIDVMRDSQQRQRPWEESSLTGDYCLAPAGNKRCGTP